MEAAAMPAESEAPEAIDAPEETASAEPTNAELAEQMQAIAQKLEGSGAEEPAPVDLASALTGGEEEYDDEDYEDADFDLTAAEPAPEYAEIAQRLDAHEQYLLGQQDRAYSKGLKDLGAKYPELQEQKMFDRVIDEIAELAEEAGNPAIAQRPPVRLVEKIYKSLKADEESASETPAEEAVSQGASLETGAGPGNQGGDVSVEDQLGDAIVATGTRKGAFG